MVAPNLTHVDERETSTITAEVKPPVKQQLSLLNHTTARSNNFVDSQFCFLLLI
jgi:NADH dehydrogenase (ubiquinone) Fe-S protein 1